MNALELRRRTLGKGVYKKTVEGNPAIAQGSLARRYLGITMQGWTEQAQYEGNQLFDASVFDGMEKSGVSVSATDGVITASGMSESAIWIQSAHFTEEDFEKFKSGNIYVKNYKTSECNYEVSIYINNTTVKEGNSPHPIPDGYLETKPNNVCFFIDIRAGIELKGSCKPMIYQDGDGTYEPYTGGAPSPSPDYPQPITSAGKYNEEAQKWEYEIKLTGKNLFPYGEGDIKIGIPYENRGRTYILNKDGSISITTQDPSLSSGSIFIFGAGDDRKHYKLPAGEYTVSTFNGNIPNMIIQLEDENSVNTRIVEAGKFELKEHEYIAYAWLYGAVGTEWNGTIYPQLEYGGVSTSYEQYKLPQTVTLTSDRPLTKWDKLEKRNGQWGWVYKSEEIESYTDESVPGEYFSTTGQLSTGAQVWYETIQETFVPLAETEQEQMNELYTFRPTTVLSNDCGCNMTLTYKTKKSLQPVSGGGIRKSSGVTSYFTFGVKWNQINKIVLKASGITEGQNIFFCGEGAKQPWIGLLYADKALAFEGIRNGTCNLTSDDILDGQFHEMIFEFDISNSDFNIVNVWDSAWSKNIIYHEIAFYNGDELLTDYVPYYKGAGYMLDKKNNVVIRATNPDDYEFA